MMMRLKARFRADMRKFSFAIGMIALYTFQPPLGFSAEVIECQVMSIHDGDSMRVKCPPQHKSQRLRMHQIDAPELEQAYGPQAKSHLKALCPIKTRARIRIHGKDQYGRLLGDVFCRGKNINHEMVASGAAWAYRRYVTDPALPRLQRRAQQARIGLWGDSNATAPWQWRYYNQGNRR